MGVFSRFSDIVNSNLNALLDKAENPERMLSLIIEEMEQTLVEVRSVSAKTIADKKELSRRVRDAQNQVNTWQQKAELAVSKGRDDLAKSALIEMQQQQKNVESLEQEVQRVESELNKLSQDVSQLQEKLNDAKSRRKSVLARRNSVQARLQVRRKTAEYDIEDAVARFEHFEQKLDRIEAEIESYDMLQSKTLSQQIDELAANDDINQQLDALKKKVDNAK